MVMAISLSAIRREIVGVETFLHTLCAYDDITEELLCELGIPETAAQNIMIYYHYIDSSNIHFITQMISSGFFESRATKSLDPGSNHVNETQIDKQQMNKNARKFSKITYLENDAADLLTLKSRVLQNDRQNNNTNQDMEFLGTLDVNHRDEFGLVAIEYALIYEKYDIVKILANVPQLDINSAVYFSIAGLPPWIAMTFAHRPRSQQLSERAISGDSLPRQEPILHGLLARKRVSLAATVLHHPKINVNQRDCDGQTPLSLAVKSNQVDTVKTMVKHTELDINAVNNNGDTALHEAIKAGHIDAAEALLAHDHININTPDSSGQTTLMLCSNVTHGARLVDTILTLFDDADINTIQANSGHTALHKAVLAKNKEMCRLLCKHSNTDPNIRDDYAFTPLDLLDSKGWIKGCPEITSVLLNAQRKHSDKQPSSIIKAIQNLEDAINKSDLFDDKKECLLQDVKSLQQKMTNNGMPSSAANGMSALEYESLVRNADFLCAKMTPKEYLPALKNAGIVSEKQCDIILSGFSKTGQCEELLKVLPHCGPNIFDIMCDIFCQQNQRFIAEKLLRWIQEHDSNC